MAETFALRWVSQADVIVNYVKKQVTFENTKPFWKHALKLYITVALIGLIALPVMWTTHSDFMSPQEIQFTAVLFYLGFLVFAPTVVMFPDLLLMIPRMRARRYRKRTKRPLRSYTIGNPSHVFLNGIHDLLDIEYAGECAETVTRAELRKAKRRWSLEIFFSKPSLGTVTIREY